VKEFKMKSIAALASVVVLLGMTAFASADPVPGPSGGVARVEARDVNVHKVLYRGGEQADFAIVGDGDTTLNIVVRDANGNELARTTGPGDRCRATWRPDQTGYFYISVINEGNVYNRYTFRAY
jgi:hypothetical protein